jgi:hypothetical protein
MSALRPLPARPSLEFERKEAKALLRRLRAGDPEALERARASHPRIAASAARIRLADAQLVIAREYGFTSWARLVRYFDGIARQNENLRTLFPPDRWDGYVRSLIRDHADGRVWVGRSLAAYVPRFYGWRLEDVFASAVTEDDARLAVARQFGCPSWEVLQERSRESTAHPITDWRRTEFSHARKAMEAGDLDALKRVVDSHPDLLRMDPEGGRLPTLMTTALAFEERGIEMRRIIDWLETQGLDLQRTLNEQLSRHFDPTPERVQWLLGRGADPNWTMPTGIPVLEYALLSFWNGEAVDVLAARARPRQALWIAAGLGDVDGVRRSLDRHGKPTKEATRLRPPFDAAGRPMVTPHPDADDDELLLEAFLVALLNNRVAVMEYMMSRGCPVDSTVYGMPMINFAVGNMMVDAVECLVRGGASLDVRGWHPEESARDLARELLSQNPGDARRRRVAELCGLDVGAMVAELDARQPRPPVLHSFIETALDLASDDARRLGGSEVDVANLLFGLLRSDSRSDVTRTFTHLSDMDVDRFRDDLADRLRAPDDRIAGERLPLRAEAQAVLDAAIGRTAERRDELVTLFDVLRELLRDESGPARGLLRQYGGDASKLLAMLDQWHARVTVLRKSKREESRR